MSRSLLVLLAAAVAVSGLSISCTKKTDSAAPAERELAVAIWPNYLSEEMQAKFTKETGIKLKISNYSSNEELLAKVQAGATGIDVAVPSDYMVAVMSKLGLLREIDPKKVPNISGLDPSLLKQDYDPENKFSLPYSWSTAGIAVNRDLVKTPIKGWKDLFTNPELKGKISLLDDVREVAAAALKVNGLSVNTTNPADLDKAKATLKELRSRVKMFTSDTIDALVNKEVAAAQTFSSDALQAAAKSGGKIEYILPEEGGTRAIDNVVILKGAKNVEEAHALINFLLSTDANVAFVTSVRGGPVVKETREKLPADLKASATLFPAKETISKFERLTDLGEATRLYDRLWTEVKAE